METNVRAGGRRLKEERGGVFVCVGDKVSVGGWR